MEPIKNILVVDDEKMLLDAVASYLESKGFCVFTAETGAGALHILEHQNISFVILDLMLPDIPGEKICEKIRRESRIPVIMLTAKTEEEDILNGLRIGADDYMTKPFSLKELHARVEAISRRASDDLKPLAEKIQWNDGALEINFQQKIVKKRGRIIGLTPIEWNILSAFFKYPKKVFTREDLISIAFDMGFDGYDRVIDTHIKNIRKKLEDNPKQPVYIQTVHGLGYRLGGDSS